MTTYAVVVDVAGRGDDALDVLRPQVRDKTRCVYGKAANYRRMWFLVRKRKGGGSELVVEVRARDIPQAAKRAALAVRRSLREGLAWRYLGSYAGSWMKLRKRGVA